eukprot:270330-Chlamydomonas_euryale.AAC.3
MRQKREAKVVRGVCARLREGADRIWQRRDGGGRGSRRMRNANCPPPASHPPSCNPTPSARAPRPCPLT